MAKNKGSAYPEFLTRSDLEAGEWDVSTSSVPQTDIAKRIMRVPTGVDNHSRAVRAQELMRAKISPPVLVVEDDITDTYGELPPGILEACEMVRINALNRHVGNNPDDLDRSGLTAQIDRAVRANDLETLVELTVTHHGTKGANAIARATRISAKKYGKPQINNLAQGLRRVLKNSTYWYNEPMYRGRLADTSSEEVCVDGEIVAVPEGYRYTMYLARKVAEFLRHAIIVVDGVPEIPKPGRLPEVSEIPQEFAPLRLRKLPLTERVAGRMGRKRSPINSGINPRRMHRYLTDPEKRIFDRRIKGIGGVVLIDQSGSMSLSTEEIWDIIKASPGCTIIGYSHGRSSPYNCWVLAENGKVVSEVVDGNGGNGVDGPALMFALSKRKKGDPLIWVCDGIVTSEEDMHVPHLSAWCAKVVAKYKVHMVPDVPEAVAALKQVRDGRKLDTRATGPVYEALRRISS